MSGNRPNAENILALQAMFTAAGNNDTLLTDIHRDPQTGRYYLVLQTLEGKVQTTFGLSRTETRIALDSYLNAIH